MDILIVGGLLVVGVVALVALFFVIRSDPKPTTPKATPQTTREELPTPIQPETAQPDPLYAAMPATTEVQPASTPVEPQAVPAAIEAQPEPVEQQAIPTTPEMQPEPPEPVQPQTAPLPIEVQPEPFEPQAVPVAKATPQDSASYNGATVRSTNEKEQPLRVHLNGQFHELTTGLRDLQQQAIEMEQRLKSLTEMFESIESDPPEEK